MKVRRDEITEKIKEEESDKLLLEKSLKALQEKLGILNTKLMEHRRLQDSYDSTIRDTELGFKKVKASDFYTYLYEYNEYFVHF